MTPVKFYRDRHSITVHIGKWACRYMWPWSPGRFGNGSRWSSGWHDITKQPDC